MRKTLYIGIGGALGAAARYLLGFVHIVNVPSVFPFNTLLINVLGCFCLAALLAAFPLTTIKPQLQLGLTTGLLGAFTTFSTLCRECVTLLYIGQSMTAMVYMFLSLILGFLAVFLGYAAANALLSGRELQTAESEAAE